MALFIFDACHWHDEIKQFGIGLINALGGSLGMMLCQGRNMTKGEGE